MRPLERTIAHGHPWIFREALAPFDVAPGTIVDVLDTRQRFLARGMADAGPLAVRVLSRSESETIDVDFWRARIEQAASLRPVCVPEETSAYRLIHGEGDRLPGIVCDIYGDYAVLAYDGDAVVTWHAAILQGLRQVLHSRGVKNLLLRRGRGPTRQLEVLDGDLPSDRLCVTEHGMKLVVDLLHGQKTGLFLDHRESRFMTRTLCSRLKNPRVLNLFGYTGGFSIAAGLGGARQVVTVDLSKPALLLAEESWRANGLPQGVHTTFGGTVESYLEATPDASFEFVIADPPSFAPNEKAVENAKKAYKSMHASSLAKVTPGGYYLTASCSSHIHRSHFEETLREGAHRCKVSLQVLGRWAGGMDHPTPMGFSEGEYLTVVLARVWPVRS